MLGRHLRGDGRSVGTDAILHGAPAKRHEDMEAAPARRLDVRLQPVILELVAQEQRRTRRRSEAVLRIEIEREPVRLVELIDPAVHHVHRDAAQVHERQQRLARAAHDVVDITAGRGRRDGNRRNVGGQVRRRLLLEEAAASHTVGASLERDGAALHPRQDLSRDSRVELCEIELRQAFVRPEQLRRIRDDGPAEPDAGCRHTFPARSLARP